MANTSDQVNSLKDNLLKSVIKLKTRIIAKYEAMLEDTSLSNVRTMIEQMIMQEKVDIELLKSTETSVYSNQDIKQIKKNDYEMVDHLINDDISGMNANDLKMVLQWGIKTYNDLHKVLQVMAEEYEEPKIKNTLVSLSMNELKKKNKLSEKYDELINQNYW